MSTETVEVARELGRLAESVRQLEISHERILTDVERGHTRLREDMQAGFRDITQVLEKGSLMLTAKVQSLERWRARINGAGKVVAALFAAAISLGGAILATLWPTAQHGAGK